MVAAGVTAIWLVGAKVQPLNVSCSMNGFGQGDCAFTNRGFVPQSRCGNVVVHVSALAKNGASDLTSDDFCSGFVWPGASAQMHFTIPSVASNCRDNLALGMNQTWQDVCDFDFKAN